MNFGFYKKIDIVLTIMALIWALSAIASVPLFFINSKIGNILLIISISSFILFYIIFFIGLIYDRITDKRHNL